MPRIRNKENRGLPRRWQRMHGAIYYRVPEGLERHWDNKKKFRLGKTEPEAYREWAKRIGNPEKSQTVGDLLARYSVEITPTKKPQTRINEIRYTRRLLAAFSKDRLEDITPQDIYEYIDKRTAKIAARREKSLLSHAFTKAVQWGYIIKHPFKGEIHLDGEIARERYVEDWEIDEVMAMKPKRKKGDPMPMLQAYINLKYLTGMRQGDLLTLTMSNIREDGIHLEQRKRGKRQIFTWSNALAEAVERAKAIRPVLSPYLFCNRRGDSYYNINNGTASGFQSIWRRFMDRVIAETSIEERFTEHDIRGKTGSDSENTEQARQRLGHESSKTTVRSYRRKPEKVTPLR